MIEVATIMMVEIDAIVGSICSRRALNMLRVSVGLSPPETNFAITTSSKEGKNDNNADMTTAKRIWGKMIGYVLLWLL